MAQPESITGSERSPTVDDMIGWLEEDGCSRRIVGWKSDWTREEVYGPPPTEPLVLGFKYGGGDQQGADRPPQRDFDINAAWRQQALAERREKQVKRMIRGHKQLIPPAIREIDRRLLKAGLSPESLKTLDTGHATDVYAKLQKLSLITGPPQPLPRIRFQVMSDIAPGKLGLVDIYLQRNCTLEDFEESMTNHRLVRFLRVKQLQSIADSQREDPAPATASSGGSQCKKRLVGADGKHALEEKMWMYQLVGEGEDSPDIGEGTWNKIHGQSDFAGMMKALVNDSSKRVVVYHESSLDAVQSAAQEADPPICESLDEALHWGGEDWDEDAWKRIIEAFDGGQLFGPGYPDMEGPGSASSDAPGLPTDISEESNADTSPSPAVFEPQHRP